MNIDTQTLREENAQVFGEEAVVTQLEEANVTQLEESRREITLEESNLIWNELNKHGQKVENIYSFDEIKWTLGFKTRNFPEQFKRKTIYVIGEACSGKSSLINTLLNTYIAPQSQVRLTGRFVRITYCRFKFVAIMNKGQLIKFYLNERVRKEDVQNTDSDDAFVESDIIIGSPSEFLKYKLYIIDTPSFFASFKTDNSMLHKLESERPIVIYVLDCSKATSDNFFILKRIQGLKLDMFYFVNKLGYVEPHIKRGKADVVVKPRFDRCFDLIIRITNACVFDGLPHRFFGTDLWRINDLKVDKYVMELNPEDNFLVFQWSYFMLCLKHLCK